MARLISQPPIPESPVRQDKLTSNWWKYFSEQSETIAQYLTSERYYEVPLDATKIRSVGTFQVPKFTTGQRDNLVSVADSTIIYNTTTNTFQGRAAGVWIDLS